MPRDPGAVLSGCAGRVGRGAAEDPRRRAGARRRLQLALEPVQALRLRPRAPARARRSRSSPGCWSDCSPGSPASATPACPSTSRAARRRHPGGRLRARARGRPQHRHGARHPARPGRPRLLRDRAQATTDEEKLDLSLSRRPNRPRDELTVYEQDVLAFFDQLLDGETGRAQRDEGPDPRALGGLARALGADDREARRRRRGRARLGPQPQLGPLADRARDARR